MVEIICSRSGLKFEAPNRRTKVHPEISWYTTHKNLDVRRTAIEVIERGQEEGWDSLEKFEEEIKIALNPPPKPRPAYNFEGAWVAKIVSASEKYRFERKFLKEVDTEGRFKRFEFQNADGIYECCYKSAKGNESRYYYQVEAGQLIQIDLQKVEALFPAIEKPSLEDCVKVDKHLGAEGAIVAFDNQIWVIVRVDSVLHWEDEDGLCGTGRYTGDCRIAFEEEKFTTYLRPATAEQIAQFKSAQSAQNAKAQAVRRLKEIAASVNVTNGAIAPKDANYPKGQEIVIRQGHYQPNELIIAETNSGEPKLWNLLYNGRDGDDWSINNIAGSWIGCWIPLSPELNAEIQSLCEVL